MCEHCGKEFRYPCRLKHHLKTNHFCIYNTPANIGSTLTENVSVSTANDSVPTANASISTENNSDLTEKNNNQFVPIRLC